MLNYKTVQITQESLRLKAKYIKSIMKLGVASFFNQISLTLVQIIMNNTLRHYGALSVYGAEIPLASAGIITTAKTNFLIAPSINNLSILPEPLAHTHGSRASLTQDPL